MAKNVKTLSLKEKEKLGVMEVIVKALKENGFDVEDGAKYGMSMGTVVVKEVFNDIQIKPIVPKTGVERYTMVE